MSRRKKKYPPYKSAKRTEPRPRLRLPLLADSEDDGLIAEENVSPSSGWLTYRPNGPGFWTTLDQGIQENRKLIREKYARLNDDIPECIELQYKIASHLMWMPDADPYVVPNDSWQIMERTFAGGLLTMSTAYRLTIDGLYSNARPLLRQVFEGLMLAKLCSVDHSTVVFDKWLDGKYTNFTNDVMNRIQSPNKDEFVRLWEILSGATHASYYSGQPDVQNEPALDAAPLNLVFLRMLLHANYHLLRSHLVTPSMRYRQRSWFPTTEIDEHRSRLATLLSFKRAPWMQKGARQFIRDFSATWQLA